MSNWWINRQRKDPFVKKRDQLGVVSRSYFKIKELNEKYNLFKSNEYILDLGAAPGGWTQYLEENGIKSLAIDLIPLKIKHENFIQTNIMNDDWIDLKWPLDFVISDIAPHFTGNNVVDLAKMVYLNNRIFEIAQMFSVPCLMKSFTQCLQDIKLLDKNFQVIKPLSSRINSSEIYLLFNNK